jgi:hypothetical protein
MDGSRFMGRCDSTAVKVSSVIRPGQLHQSRVVFEQLPVVTARDVELTPSRFGLPRAGRCAP